MKASAGRLSLWLLGGAALALLIFVRITRELLEGDVGAMESTILLAVAKTPGPWLTVACGRDSAGIDHLGDIVLRLHPLDIARVARPDGRPAVTRGFAGREY